MSAWRPCAIAGVCLESAAIPLTRRQTAQEFPLKRTTQGSLVVAFCMAAVAEAWAAGSAPPATSALPAKLNRSDVSYITDAMAQNQSEIDASNYVMKHASGARAREFAQQILRDDAQTLTDLQKANDGSIPAPLPGTQADRFFLNKTGNELDKSYLDLMVDSLDVAVGKCQAAVELPVYGAAVRAVARKTLPAIRRHDATARSLDASTPSK